MDQHTRNTSLNLDWKNIFATAIAAFAGNAGAYVLATFYQSIDRCRRRVEDLEREWHAEDMRQSKDHLYPILANNERIAIRELEKAIGNTRHLEGVLETLRRMAACWRDGDVHRHYFLRLLGHDVREWQNKFNRIDVPEGNYWKPYFQEIAKARFE